MFDFPLGELLHQPHTSSQCQDGRQSMLLPELKCALKASQIHQHIMVHDVQWHHEFAEENPAVDHI